MYILPYRIMYVNTYFKLILGKEKHNGWYVVVIYDIIALGGTL